MYDNLFDFNRDGELDAGEQALEYMTFRMVTDLDKQETEDQDLGEEECDG